MAIQHISAITLAVQNMARSVNFYQKLGLELVHGGQEASFSSFRAGQDYINLSLTPSASEAWWGRIIFRVNEVDQLYKELNAKGLVPEVPRDGGWGERYFHLRDPDGHELSFAQLLS